MMAQVGAETSRRLVNVLIKMCCGWTFLDLKKKKRVEKPMWNIYCKMSRYIKDVTVSGTDRVIWYNGCAVYKI
jgi:hypothetical protein